MSERKFLEYANEAGRKIREINQLISGTEYPVDGSLLRDVGNSIFLMIQIYLSPIVWKEIDSDELNDLATKIMFAENNDLDDLIEGIMVSSKR